jgi:hypothetical protein
VRVTGALAAQETGADAFVATGTVEVTPVVGFMAARETGADVIVITGLVTGELRRAGPRRGGVATEAEVRPLPVAASRPDAPQFVRPSPAVARRPATPNYRRSA